MKVRLPDGRVVEGQEVNFETLKEGWNEYKLEDGTILKVKLVLAGVVRVEEYDPMTGSPHYFIKSTNVISTIVPDELKKLPAAKPSSVEVR